MTLKLTYKGKTYYVELIDYATFINRQRKAEGNPEPFTPGPRKWGIHLGGPLVIHRGQLYLSGYVYDHPENKEGMRDFKISEIESIELATGTP